MADETPGQLFVGIVVGNRHRPKFRVDRRNLKPVLHSFGGRNRPYHEISRILRVFWVVVKSRATERRQRIRHTTGRQPSVRLLSSEGDKFLWYPASFVEVLQDGQSLNHARLVGFTLIIERNKITIKRTGQVQMLRQIFGIHHHLNLMELNHYYS